MKRQVSKKIALISLGGVLLGTLPANAAFRGAPGPGLRAPYAVGEVLVKFKARSKTADRSKALSRRGATKLRDLGPGGFSHVRLAPDQKVEEAIDSFRADAEVEAVQPNYIYRIQAVPNDPKFSQLWGLKNTAQTIVSTGTGTVDATHNPGTSGKDMGLSSAWDSITDCSSVPVAVVDSGVNYQLADLASNMWDGGVLYPHHGYDFVDGTDDPMDKNGHGTHVAGTIGAVGNNGAGSTGVCWTASIMAIRVMDATGTGSTAQVVQGVNFAVDHGARVINMSLGGGPTGTADDAAFQTAITHAQDNGVVVVVAAGNGDATGAGVNNDNGTDPMYPCNFTNPNIVCVAALDQSYSLASFSNYGSTSVDVGAPGVNIVSDWAGLSASSVDSLSGWTKSATAGASWGEKVLSGYLSLVNPSTFDGASASYVNNADGRVWKNFTSLNGVNVALATFYLLVETQANHDFIQIAYKAGGGDPFAGGGTLVDQQDGSTQGYFYYMTEDLTPCIGASCGFGFRLTSDASTVGYGVAITEVAMETLTLQDGHTNVLEGTSMATPHVAGLAAMLFAYNPDYTWQDVVTAIKSGGVAVPALTGKTTSGKAAHAQGALAYINAPTGVSAVKAP